MQAHIYIMEDWDLQAVVRGCTNNIDEVPAANTIDSQPSCLAPLMSVDQYLEDDVFHDFPYHLFESTKASDELEELYKPFYPILNDPISFPPTLLTSSSSSTPKDHAKEPDKLIKKIKQLPTTKCKRRKKSEHKKVVKEVEAEELRSDMWAWRKYGQKSIKGSPYPRSYYKCSSSKGCSARKQVERNSSKPDMFIITYTAEHSHAHPTRRNPRAGSARSNKVPASEMEMCSTSFNSNKLLSPTIDLISLMAPTDR